MEGAGGEGDVLGAAAFDEVVFGIFGAQGDGEARLQLAGGVDGVGHGHLAADGNEDQLRVEMLADLPKFTEELRRTGMVERQVVEVQ